MHKYARKNYVVITIMTQIFIDIHEIIVTEIQRYRLQNITPNANNVFGQMVFLVKFLYSIMFDL